MSMNVQASNINETPFDPRPAFAAFEFGGAKVAPLSNGGREVLGSQQIHGLVESWKQMLAGQGAQIR